MSTRAKIYYIYIYTSGTCAQAHTPMPRKEEEKVEEEEVDEEVEVGGLGVEG